jgi:hypothetical protein
MAYREVTMIEVKEVLRLWFAGTATKRIAAILGLDPKTVRRYLRIAREAGVEPQAEGVTDAQVTRVLLALHPAAARPRGDSWALCEAQRKPIEAFLEYAQARAFHIDPTRVRHPKDKARVERPVPGVRDDCFAGEELIDLDAARAWGRQWCLEDYGQRRHSWTQRRPREHFDAEERAALRPAPSEPYDPPLWNSPKVGRNHYALVAAALYSLPTRWIGVRLRARTDRATVRFYHHGVLIKTHPRCPPGGKSTHADDFPAERTAYALRDISSLQTQADAHGEAVGRFVRALLDEPLPWTRTRRVYAVLGLACRYGSGRVNEACALALVAGMFDVHRLQRMLVLAVAAPPPAPAAPTPAPSRFLRPATQYRLALVPSTSTPEGDPA